MILLTMPWSMICFVRSSYSWLSIYFPVCAGDGEWNVMPPAYSRKLGDCGFLLRNGGFLLRLTHRWHHVCRNSYHTDIWWEKLVLMEEGMRSWQLRYLTWSVLLLTLAHPTGKIRLEASCDGCLGGRRAISASLSLCV